MNLSQAREILDRLISELSPGCERIEIAGGVRRCKPDVHDLELVAIPKIVTVDDLFGNPTNHYSMLDAELHRLAATTHMLKMSGGEKYQKYMLPEGITLDLFITTPDQFGWIFTLRTGSADFNKWLVTPRRYGGARPAYIKSSDGWLWSGGNRSRTPEEQDAFRVLGVEWIDPRYRSTEHREMWKLIN